MAVCIGIGYRPGTDSKVYYDIAQTIRQGGIQNIYVHNDQPNGFYYGPIATVIFAPFGYFSYLTFHWIWLSIEVFSFVVFWIMLYQVFPALKRESLGWLWLIVWVASIKPIHSSFQCCNLQIMFAAIFVTCQVWSQSESKLKNYLAGFLLVLPAAIKVFPLFICLLFYLTKNKAVRRGLFIGAVTFALLPFLVFGYQTGSIITQGFINSLALYHQVYTLDGQTVMLSLPSLLTTWLHGILTPLHIQLIIRIIIILVSSWFFLFAWKNRKIAERQSLLWALALALMTLLNSTSRPDYFVFYVPAFAALVYCWSEKGGSFLFKVGSLVSLALIMLISEWTLRSRELGHRLEDLRIPVIGMILLCLLLSVRLLKDFKNPKMTMLHA